MLWLRRHDDTPADPAVNDHRFRPGDRVRWDTTDDDGLPKVHYGHVAGSPDATGRVAVMFDDLLPGTTVVAVEALIVVDVTTVVLYLDAGDLLDCIGQYLVSRRSCNRWICRQPTSQSERLKPSLARRVPNG